MIIPTGFSHATVESNDISELVRLVQEKEQQIDYIIKNKTGRPGEYPVGKHPTNKKTQTTPRSITKKLPNLRNKPKGETISRH